MDMQTARAILSVLKDEFEDIFDGGDSFALDNTMKQLGYDSLIEALGFAIDHFDREMSSYKNYAEGEFPW